GRRRRPLGRAAARTGSARPPAGTHLGGGARMTMRRAATFAVPIALLVLLVLLPKMHVDIPVLFKDGLNSPGTLQLLALMLVFAGVAFTYDLLFGYTGLLSFGHALYFAVGVYMAAIAMTHWHWSFWPSVLFTAAVGLVLPLLVGAVSLRVGGIAFA